MRSWAKERRVPLVWAVVVSTALVWILAVGCSSSTAHKAPDDGAVGGTPTGGATGSNDTTTSSTSMGAGEGGEAGQSAGSEGECAPGERRCDDLTPMTCSEASLWTSDGAACALGCFEGACTQCSEGATRCANGAVQSCTDGAWSAVEVCDVTCEDSACVDACTEGRLQCNGSELQVCDGTAYVSQEECEFVCSDGACGGSCVPDARRCNPEAADESQSCSAAGEWSEGVACATGTFCVQGACKPCEPDSKRCASSGPQLCSQEGEWVNQGACEAPTSTCFEGDCVACDPGDKRCNGNELQECSSDGTLWEVAETCSGDTPACLESTQSCGRCSEGETQCNGAIVQSCNDQGAWENLTACSGSTPRCVSGACTQCDPSTNERRCQDQDTAQQCQSDGTWGSNMNCSGNTPLCRDDINFTCGCEEGQRRCRSGTVPEECQGGAWVAQSTCTGTLNYCLPATGECVDCAPNSETCQGNVAQTCNSDGSWQSLASCAGNTVNCGSCDLGEPCDQDSDCDSGACVNDKCTECLPNDTMCTGQTPQLCSQSGSWTAQAPCSGMTPVCEDGACVPGPAVCGNGYQEQGEECDDGEQTLTCSADCTSCSTPSPMTVLDQGVGFCTTGSFTCLEGWARQNGQTVAQQFHVSQVGTLTEVELYVQNDVAATKPMVLELVDAGMNANLMDGADPSVIEATYVVATAQTQGHTSAQWESFDFSGHGIVMDPNKTYFLWLRMPSSPTTPSTQYIRWNLWADSGVADPYPGGRPYFCPAGSTCQLEVQTYWDYSFRVHLELPLPLCE